MEVKLAPSRLIVEHARRSRSACSSDSLRCLPTICRIRIDPTRSKMSAKISTERSRPSSTSRALCSTSVSTLDVIFDPLLEVGVVVAWVLHPFGGDDDVSAFLASIEVQCVFGMRLKSLNLVT